VKIKFDNEDHLDGVKKNLEIEFYKGCALTVYLKLRFESGEEIIVDRNKLVKALNAF
jgi:hypothetical protein